MKNWLLTLLSCLVGIMVYGQQEQTTNKEEDTRRHKIAPMLGYTYVFNTIDSEFGKKDANLLVPTFGLDYTYKINQRLSVGWYNDIELSTYIIQNTNGDRIIRERVFVTALVAVYAPFPGFAVLAGYGLEFDQHQNFDLLRVGVEYETPLSTHWDLGYGITFDYKKDYSAIGLGISFARKL